VSSRKRSSENAPFTSSAEELGCNSKRSSFRPTTSSVLDDYGYCAVRLAGNRQRHPTRSLMTDFRWAPQNREIILKIIAPFYCSPDDAQRKIDALLQSAMAVAIDRAKASLLRLRQTLAERYKYREKLCTGLAGGIGAPASAAAALAIGCGLHSDRLHQPMHC
jgi:hypothetical protein